MSHSLTNPTTEKTMTARIEKVARRHIYEMLKQAVKIKGLMNDSEGKINVLILAITADLMNMRSARDDATNSLRVLEGRIELGKYLTGFAGTVRKIIESKELMDEVTLNDILKKWKEASGKVSLWLRCFNLEEGQGSAQLIESSVETERTAMWTQIELLTKSLRSTYKKELQSL